jgi:hypothetical protein
LVEQPIRNRQVPGSSPGLGSIEFSYTELRDRRRAAVRPLTRTWRRRALRGMVLLKYRNVLGRDENDFVLVEPKRLKSFLRHLDVNGRAPFRHGVHLNHGARCVAYESFSRAV